MAKSTQTEELIEAVDQLMGLSDIELSKHSNKKPQELLSKLRAKTGWKDVSSTKDIEHQTKKTLKVVEKSIKSLAKQHKDSSHHESDYQAGVVALVNIANEAIAKVDSMRSKLSAKKSKTESLFDSKEYQALTKTLERTMPEVIERAKAEREKNTASLTDIRDRGLWDLEAIKDDSHYELLFLKREGGTPFLTQGLKKRLMTISSFDNFVKEGFHQDPMLVSLVVQDQDAVDVAFQILKSCKELIDELYRDMHLKLSEQLCFHINALLVALFSAANPKHITNPSKKQKGNLKYLLDFHHFLSLIIESEDFTHLLQTSSPSRVQKAFLSLIHHLNHTFYIHPTIHDHQMQYIEKMMELGQAKQFDKTTCSSETFAKEYDALYRAFKRFPSIPLRKAIELGQQRHTCHFSPISEGIIPSTGCRIEMENLDAELVHMPSPTHQSMISKAYVTKDFETLLSSMKDEFKESFLMINTQNRTSWTEYARAHSLELLDRKFSNLTLISIDMHTSFYHQEGEYSELKNAKEFKAQLLEHVIFEGPTSCFYLSQNLAKKRTEKLIKSLIDDVHTVCFANKTTLSKSFRQCFIDIFYAVFVSAIASQVNASYISWVCKDGLDTSSSATLIYYLILSKFMDKGFNHDEEHAYLLKTLFAPSIINRGRVITSNWMKRVLQVMAFFEQASLSKQKMKGIFKELKQGKLHLQMPASSDLNRQAS